MIKNIRLIRLLIAGTVFILLTMLFLDFTGIFHDFFGELAKIQFVPALLAGNFIIAIAILILTRIFGRIYCSIICPLGVCQDIASCHAGFKKKNNFSYTENTKIQTFIRYFILALYGVSAIFGISVITVLLEPYSAFGRMITQIVRPFYLMGNNVLAFFAEHLNNYAFYKVDISLNSGIAFYVAILTFLIIGIWAWRKGRAYCNTICPVGTILSLFATFSHFKVVINKSQCISCGVCAKNCKASCIDPKGKKIDYSRCVVCLNCIESCPKGGIVYTNEKSAKEREIEDKNNNSRRNVISSIGFLLLGLFTRKLHAYDYDGGLVPLETKRSPKRTMPIIPPGSDDIRSFSKRCTGCQLCVSACINNVLQPSNNINQFLQPQLSFEKGYCRPECVQCSKVCPNGAINSITVAEKSAIQIGYAVWNSDLCIINTDKERCDLCAFCCPTDAITMIQQDNNVSSSLRIPMIDIHRCIGCGACEQLCPVRPFSAIYVEGIDTHRMV